LAAKENVAVKIASRCLLCDDRGWICERHADKPWDGQHACRSTRRLAALSWTTPFDDLISLPGGRKLVTLKAGTELFA
jgi:hypothetical protein